MAEEFQIDGGNWWDSTRTRFESGAPPSSSSAVNTIGWPTEIVDLNFKTRSSNFMDSVSVSTNSMIYQDTQKLAQDHNLQMMGLGISSQTMDWNQNIPLSGCAKVETSFQSVFQQNLNSPSNFQQEIGINSWRQKLYSSNISEGNEYKKFNHSNSSTFQMDPGVYNTNPSPFISSQGILVSDHNHQQCPNFSSQENYGNYSGELLSSFIRNSPPKQPPNSQLQFSSNAPVWNAGTASVDDVPGTFFSQAKKSTSDALKKRSRSETHLPLPPFKVRKEKMADKITALQQLVSPFGKTDTASVLSETIEYIKYLHEQVNNVYQLLSKPYMKSEAPIQQYHQSCDKSKEYFEGPQQNLSSRGLCLVPVSSTFPLTHETSVDFWTPTFGGTHR